LPQESQNYWKEVTEKIQESEGFYDHPNERVLKEDKHDTTQETCRSA